MNQNLTSNNSSYILNDFGVEWKLLEMLCKGISSPAQEKEFFEIIQSRDVNWGELIEQSLRHKMITMLAHYVSFPKFEEHIPIRVREHLLLALNVNKYKRKIWYQEMIRVTQLLTQNGVQVAGRKESALESTVYRGNGSRLLGDIDLLIKPGDQETVKQLMLSEGYNVGIYNHHMDQVVPYERKMLIAYKLNPDHMPVFSYLTGDVIVPVIEVDFATSLTWTMSGYDIPTDQVLATTIHQRVSLDEDSCSVDLPYLLPTYQFIDTVLHLFKEAWIEQIFNMEKDVALAAFMDVIRLWNLHRSVILRREFMSLIYNLGIEEPIAWVLTHLDRTFDTQCISRLELEGVVTEKMLASAGSSAGSNRMWKGTMRQRLHTKERNILFS